MIIILQLLASSGLAYFLANSELLSFFRIWLFQKSPWFLKLFDCSFCLACHTSYIIWLIYNFSNYNWFHLPIFIFAGGISNLIINGLINKLYD